MKRNVYSAIGNESRLKILACLGKTPKTVNELIEKCGLSQSAVSQHLQYLREVRLVQCSKNGQFQIYQSNDAVASQLSEKILTHFNK